MRNASFAFSTYLTWEWSRCDCREQILALFETESNLERWRTWFVANMTKTSTRAAKTLRMDMPPYSRVYSAWLTWLCTAQNSVIYNLIHHISTCRFLILLWFDGKNLWLAKIKRVVLVCIFLFGVYSVRTWRGQRVPGWEPFPGRCMDLQWMLMHSSTLTFHSVKQIHFNTRYIPHDTGLGHFLWH